MDAVTMALEETGAAGPPACPPALTRRPLLAPPAPALERRLWAVPALRAARGSGASSERLRAPDALVRERVGAGGSAFSAGAVP